MDYDQLIKNWHTKASDEDYFSKFVFEYLAFIAFLRKKKFSNAKNDRDAIQLLKQNERSKDAYFIEIESKADLQILWEEIRKELGRARLGNVSGAGDEVEESKWWNHPHTNFDEQTEEEKNRIKGVVNDLSDWINMVEFWHSIRNNLFHGAKNPKNTRDRFLVERAYKTLRPLVETLLNAESIF